MCEIIKWDSDKGHLRICLLSATLKDFQCLLYVARRESTQTCNFPLNLFTFPLCQLSAPLQSLFPSPSSAVLLWVISEILTPWYQLEVLSLTLPQYALHLYFQKPTCSSAGNVQPSDI